MSGSSDSSRTHKPTPKRQKEFRQRGEVAISRDLTSSLTLVAGVIGGSLGAAATWGALCAMTRTAVSGETSGAVAAAARHGFVVAVAPALVTSLAGCVIAGCVQLGWPPVLKRPSFDMNRWFALGGLGELKPTAMVRRALLAIAKVAVIGAVVVAVVRGEASSLSTIADPQLLPSRLGGALVRLALFAAAAFAALGAIDFVLARRRLATKMKMTPDELKREMRESEGDPHVKGRRRRRMRELAKRRLVAETKKADVVLVNPTHYAVALRYQAGENGAPKVVAKGTDEVAARIREAARSAGVPVVSRPPLTRALWKLVPEGQEIPAAMFHAVAEVLAYVYRLRQARSGGRA